MRRQLSNQKGFRLRGLKQAQGCLRKARAEAKYEGQPGPGDLWAHLHRVCRKKVRGGGGWGDRGCVCAC